VTDLADLIGKTVRIWDGPHFSVRAEGKVIGICEVPTIIVRDEHGNHHHEASSLPRDILPDPEPPTIEDVDRLLSQIRRDKQSSHYWRDGHQGTIDSAETWLLSLRDWLESGATR
jgi:hypothetical protein